MLVRIGAAPVDGAANAELHRDPGPRAGPSPARAHHHQRDDFPEQAGARRRAVARRRPAEAGSDRVISADFLIEDADLVATCAGPAPRLGAAQGDIAALARASVASLDGRIVFVGRAQDGRHEVSLKPDATVVDGHGRTVVPGFVDSHTHLVYAGDRRDELQRRLAGATYAEIAEGGGGIVKTVAATRAASEADLAAAARPRLAAMLAQRHHDRGGQERVWPRPRVRAEDAAGHQAARRGAARVADRHLHGRPRVPRRVSRRSRPLRRPAHQRHGAGGGRRGPGRVVRCVLRAGRLHA